MIKQGWILLFGDTISSCIANFLSMIILFIMLVVAMFYCLYRLDVIFNDGDFFKGMNK